MHAFAGHVHELPYHAPKQRRPPSNAPNKDWRRFEPASFWTGLVAGWDAFIGFWSGFLVVVAVLLPWLVTGAIIAVGVVYLVRWNRKRQATRPQPPAPSASSRRRTTMATR